MNFVKSFFHKKAILTDILKKYINRVKILFANFVIKDSLNYIISQSIPIHAKKDKLKIKL